MLFTRERSWSVQKGEEYMKRVCAACVVLAVPRLALADEQTSPDPLNEARASEVRALDRSASESYSPEAPRLLLDNIIGIRASSGGANFGDPVITGGPIRGRIVEAPGAPFRTLTIRLEADGRVWKSLTLGGVIGFTTSWSRDFPFYGQSSRDSSKYAIEFAPRVGWFAPIAKDLYLWPRIGPTISIDTLQARIGATTDLSLVVAIHRHVFIATGPSLDFVHDSGDSGADQLRVGFRRGSDYRSESSS